MALFVIFKYGHYAADQVYFYQSNLKKNSEYGRERDKNSFSKSHKELKNGEKKCLYLPFTSKNNRQKENSTIKFCFKFFISPPKWENWFLTRLKGKKLVEFLFILFLDLQPTEAQGI